MAAAGPNGAGWALWHEGSVSANAQIRVAPLVAGNGSPTAPVAFTDSFTSPGQTTAHSVAVAKTVTTVTIRSTWANAGDRFTIGSLRLPSGRLTSALGKRRPPKVSRSRGPRFVQAKITNVRPGRLGFTVVSEKVARPTNVKTTVTRRK
jgi:hypothetical protein